MALKVDNKILKTIRYVYTDKERRIAIKLFLLTVSRYIRTS